MRSVFDIKRVNLTEFARSFALYRNMEPSEKKKRTYKERQEEEKKDANDENKQMFTKRLKMAKLKELDRRLWEANRLGGNERAKVQKELDYVKKEIYVNEFKMESRMKGFENARKNVKKQALSEFM